MTKDATIRASSVDNLFVCPPSILSTTHNRITSQNTPAMIGKVVHECAAAYVESKKFDADAMCSVYGLVGEDVDTVRKLAFCAAGIWDRDISKYFTRPQVESSIKSSTPITVNGVQYYLSGTIDVASGVGATEAIFLDWKSGFVDDGYANQMLTYAYLLWDFMGRPQTISITGIVVFLRHRYFDVVKYDARTLEAWEYDLAHNVLENPDKFSPGPRCNYCEIRSSCEARREVVAGSIDDILSGNTDGWYQGGMDTLKDLTDVNKYNDGVGDILSDMMFRISVCDSAIKSAKEMIKATLKRVGPIPCGAKSQMDLKETEVKSLVAEKAIPVLRDSMSDSDIAAASRISLTKVMQTVSGRAPRGKKGEVRDGLVEKLDEAGAIRRSVQHRIVEVSNEEEEADTTTSEKES